jgi:hypothetical protein
MRASRLGAAKTLLGSDEEGRDETLGHVEDELEGPADGSDVRPEEEALCSRLLIV